MFLQCTVTADFRKLHPKRDILSHGHMATINYEW